MKKTIISTTTIGAVAISSLTGVTVGAESSKGIVLDTLNTDAYVSSATVQKFKEAITKLDATSITEFEKAFNEDNIVYQGLNKLDKENVIAHIKFLSDIKAKIDSNSYSESELYDLRLKIAEYMNRTTNATGFPLDMLLTIDETSDILYHTLDSLIKGYSTDNLIKMLRKHSVDAVTKTVTDALKVKKYALPEYSNVQIQTNSMVQERTSNIVLKGQVYGVEEEASVKIKLGSVEKEVTISTVNDVKYFEVDMGKISDITLDSSATDLGAVSYKIIYKSKDAVTGEGEGVTPNKVRLVKDHSEILSKLYSKGLQTGLEDTKAWELATGFGALLDLKSSELSSNLATFKTKIPANNADLETYYTELGNYLTSLVANYESLKAENNTTTNTVTPTDSDTINVTNPQSNVVQDKGTTGLDLGSNTSVDSNGNVTYQHERLEDSVVKGLKNPFTDMDDIYSKNEAMILYYAGGGIMKGSNDKFNPWQKVQRGQLAAVLARAVGGDVDTKTPLGLSDVGSYWYAYHAQHLVNKGIMAPLTKDAQGKVVEDASSKSFLPHENIQRKDLAVILKRFLEFEGVDTSGISVEHISFTDVQNGKDTLTNEELEAIALMESLGIFHGDAGNFKPFDNANRAQLAKVIFNTLELVGVVDVQSIVSGYGDVSLEVPTGTTEVPTGTVG